MLIVPRTLLVVGETLVRLLNELELFCGVLARVLIGVPPEGRFLVRLK